MPVGPCTNGLDTNDLMLHDNHPDFQQIGPKWDFSYLISMRFKPFGSALSV